MTNFHQNTNDAWPETGFVRLSSILAPTGPLPISRSSWWAGVASRSRITAWRVNDLRALIGNAR